MANPVTQAILKNIADPPLVEFVSQWDALEELVISVFRSKSASSADRQEFLEQRAWLRAHYPAWQEFVAPFWRQSRIKDQEGIEDPFLFVLQVEEAAGLVGNWQVMRHLPAAREALNQFLLSRIETGA
jgi:hypothetical protein